MESKRLPSRSFCILPWIHIFSVTDGSCKICCHSIDDKEFVNNSDETLFLYQHDIEDIWNCKSIQAVRIRMLNGENVQDCSICYSLEEKTGTSHRIYYFSLFYHEYLKLNRSGEFEDTLKNNGKAQFNPLYLILALSNRCNLSCRMCFPQSSSSIAREAARFIESKIKGNDDYIPYFYNINGDYNSNTIPKAPWKRIYDEFQNKYDYLNSENFWNQIEKCVPYLNHFTIHGGEPMLSIKQIDKLVDSIVAQKREDQIHFNIFTNLILGNFDFIKKLSDVNWQSLQVTFSIDGFEMLQEYIRYPQKWEVFDRNLKMFLKLSKKIKLSASITVQAYNVFHLTEILEYLESFWETKQIEIYFSFLKVPSCMKIDVLQKNTKEQTIKKLSNFIKKSRSINEENDISELERSLNIIIEELQYEDEDLLERRMEFIRHTNALDELRGQKILDVCPEMETLFS